MCFLETVTLITAYLSDQYKTRAIPIGILSIIATVGYAVYLGEQMPLSLI